MKVFIQTHSYLINMDHVVYFRSLISSEGCRFTMLNGNSIDATCSYDLVVKELNNHQWARKDGTYDINMVVITLDY